jgi:hypothetical protein
MLELIPIVGAPERKGRLQDSIIFTGYDHTGTYRQLVVEINCAKGYGITLP